MIQSLASRHRRHIARFIGLVFYLSILIPAEAAILEQGSPTFFPGNSGIGNHWIEPLSVKQKQIALHESGRVSSQSATEELPSIPTPEKKLEAEPPSAVQMKEKPDIDGPSQPEMSSFKPAGTNDMVNLFTGDFSYNIPLLDVGGYPVNIFYDGGVSMEQEASWVGLGWNINPGNVNRNMRGVPDDFNGEEKLTQELKTKPNITWGVRLGADFEFVGIKDFLGISVGADLGVNFNNYLGPAIEIGIKGGANFTVSGKVSSEKSTADSIGSLKVGLGVGANLSSRYGLTVSPNISLTAGIGSTSRKTSIGGSLSTSYNSRTGIKGLQLSSQLSFSRTEIIKRKNKDELESKTSTSSIPMFSSSISFVKPTYLPTMRTVNTNSAWSGRFQIGGGLWGGYASGEIEVYKQKSEIKGGDITQLKPMVGFLYADMAVKNRDAVMDFSRINDKEVTPKTPVISAPQYAYDVFSIQGEGTGGSIRLYRNDIGYMKDNYTGSKDESFGIGVDIGIPGHFGGNFNLIKTPSTIGDWNLGNKLKNTSVFSINNRDTQRVYFKNPGESSVIDPADFDKIGGVNLVRYKLGGTSSSPTVEPILQRFGFNQNYLGEANPTGILSKRTKRTQVVSYLNAADAVKIGLEPTIRNYNLANPFDVNKNLSFAEINRVGGDRKAHHISEIDVTEGDGKRYVYGLPVYNITQQDFTFTVGGSGYATQEQNEVLIGAGEASVNGSPHMSGTGRDGYVEVTTTPAYAHSFLLTGLLSSDYVDISGNGITEDDMGSAVKFNYTYCGEHQWRTPHTSLPMANFNAGSRSEIKDDKGIISTGRRESWYLHSIESKTMIALFTLDTRHDGKGIIDGINAGINGGDNSIRCLRKIDLYNKADIKKNGLANARPIKTVHFDYDYSLCKQTRDNTYSGEGKLTLKSIWFTYQGQRQNSTQKNKYLFSYYKDNNQDPAENPDFSFNASDRWGNYKAISSNPDNMSNSLYPYSTQNKTTADVNAGAWQLKRILLPSGAEISVQYETDDYGFVQNKRAAVMTGLFGFSNTSVNPVISNQLYVVNGNNVTENNIAFIKVTEPCSNQAEVYQKYLQGMKQMAFKLAVYMPMGTEYIDCYADIDGYDVYNTGQSGVYGIWVSLKNIAGMSPLSLTALEHMKEHLPGQTFDGYDVSESTGLEQVGKMLEGWLQSMKGAFSDLATELRVKMNRARYVNLTRSFVRVNDPDGYKYGGGHRVKKVTLKDNWNKMTNQFTSAYGQEYDYTTTEIFNGGSRTISSGVASYEPSIGGDENPFQTIHRVVNTLPAGPASYGAIEMPFLDALFPAPSVGYSKVTVTSIGKKQNPDPANKKTRSGVGKQVSEFYTAKDYPVIYDYTALDPSTDKQVHRSSKTAFFYKWAFDSRAISQGFLVVNNDMHGKMRSQSSYAENDPNTRINYTENFYRNTGQKSFDEKFDFVYNAQSGEIRPGNMGIDIELMTDTREFSVKSSSYDIQGQLDYFPVFIPPVVWLPFVWFVSGNSENTYRAVTTTKVVNYHAVLDSVVVIDKGSQVSTKNLVYDAETGQVIVNRTNNEFDKAVYTVNYPAYWAYSGMGLAYKNIDAVYSGVTFYNGAITVGMSSTEINNMFESGDELYIIDAGSTAGCDPAMASSGSISIIWTLDKNKNNSSLSNPVPDFIFIDKDGKPYTRTGVKFRIVRSGHRNILGASLAAVTTQIDPRVTVGLSKILTVNNNSKVINASAVEYKEKWQTDNDVFKRYISVPNTSNPQELVVNGNFTAGNTGFTSNYWYCNTNPSPGCYRISPTSSGWFGTAPPCTQHTAGGGNMMQIDGGNSFNTVWAQTISVTPNTNYSFSVWIASINEYNTPTPVGKIQFLINGNGISPVQTAEVGPCVWKKVSVAWNSGSNTSVTIGILNIDWSGAGNDYALDDISFISTDGGCGATQEVEDCTGYLERRINPYRKGLLGNFRGYRNMIFYGEKMESNPLVATNLAVNGYLKDFNLYWTFNGYSNLVPDLTPNSRWIWNTESTRFNAKGLEIETKDAMGIYTSAQYGYLKTIPLAIASNSRAGDMFFDGFEDYDYAETLNNTSYNPCTQRHINFTTVPGFEVFNPSSAGFTAHTGKSVLKINAGSNPAFPVPIRTTVDETFPLTFTQKDINSYTQQGITIVSTVKSPPSSSLSISQNPANGLLLTVFQSGESLYCAPDGSYYSKSHYFTINARHYLKINQCSTYTFRVSSQNGFNQSVGLISFTVYDENNIPVTLTYTGYSGLETYYTCYLNQGNYRVESVLQGGGEKTCQAPFCNICGGINPEKPAKDSLGKDPILPDCPPPGPCTESVGYQKTHYFKIEIMSPTHPAYLPDQQTSCSYTLPIAGANSMLNPVFGIPSGKKMVFSAWVRENCGNPQNGVPCNLTGYANNEVQIDFGSGNPNNIPIKPAGPIIEGWQRYEGYFTAPTGVTTANIRFINNSGSALYFDDIRIHPFNSNMKSYVYDPVNMRLTSELDANNYASFYEYDEEGTLIRTKVETREGIKTVTESRSAKQKNITTF